MDEQDPRAYIMNAQKELAALRADIASEFGGSSCDCYLQAVFMSYIDAADSNLRKALR